MRSFLRYYWRRWRVKYKLQPLVNRMLRPLHLKAAVMLGDDYDPAERRHIMSIPEYREYYGDDAVDNRRFYSFGAGGWSHEPWTSSDFYVNAPEYQHAYMPWNIAKLQQCPVQSDSAWCTHSQHMIEHLSDMEAEFFFRENYRILRPGGIMRVAVPDSALACDMWRRKDPLFFRRLRPLTPTQAFVIHFASELIWGQDFKSPPRITDEKIANLFDEEGLEGALDILTSMVPKQQPRPDPENHVSWWTHKKLGALLKRIGFSEVHNMCPGISISPAMRDPRYFDTNQPYITLCLDAVK